MIFLFLFFFPAIVALAALAVDLAILEAKLREVERRAILDGGGK